MKKYLDHYSVRVATIIGFVLALLLGFTLYELYRQSKVVVNRVIVDQVAQLHAIFKKIDERCEIISIMGDRNRVDFLQVSKFVGARIGPLLLRYPQKWEGPYLEQNPMVQGTLYEIVKMRDGYALVPGDGVTLADGKVIGSDILFSLTTDIDSLITPAVGLEYERQPLIARLTLRHLRFVPESKDGLLQDDIAA